MKCFLLLTWAVLGSLGLAANCLDGDCENGVGTAKLANGDMYVGEWRGGLMHGAGTYTYKTGAVYAGEFRRGKLEGRGRMTYPDGAYYDGAWADNKKNGEGKLVLPTGKTRAGTWANGKLTAPPATRPRRRPARPASGNPAGAIASVAPADTPAAEAEATDTEDLRDCNAVFCEDGRGRFRYRDGAEYVGEFEEGQPSGEGEVRYANGDVYRGGWFANAPDGDGAYTFSNGKRVAGRWDDGRLVRRAYAADDKPVPSAPARAPVTEKEADGTARMYAVVVGIGAYNAMQTLKYTDDDAYQMYAFLKSPEGGALADEQVELLVDERATKANIERALTTTLAQADGDDIVVFYYSGHGVDGYFVPVDFDGANNLLSFRGVEELIERSSAKHKLVLADACHSGGLLAARSATANSAARLYEAFEVSPGGTALLLSSRSEEVSLESGGLRSGVFSHFVMRGMKGEADADANRIVTVNELFDYVYANVRDYTGRRQTPVLTGQFDGGMPVASMR